MEKRVRLEEDVWKRGMKIALTEVREEREWQAKPTAKREGTR
jgi:hypothetical protein